MTYYIIATRKVDGKESEITHYKFNTDKSNSGEIVTKSALRGKININTDKFFSYNISKNTTVVCEWYKIGDNGEPFLKSDPNGTKKDNLLELPDC